MNGIKNVSIETVTGGYIEKGIIIYDETIHYAGPERHYSGNDTDIDWIDGGGGIVFPGFIDVHTHLGIDEEGLGQEGADYNETSSHLTPQMRVIDGINPFDEGYDRALRGGVTTVQVLPGSANVIGGLTAVIKVKPSRPVEQQVIKFPAALKIAFGENPKRFHSGKTVTRMGVAAALRETFWKAVRKGNKKPDTMAEEVMQEVIKNRLPVRAHAHRADDILTAIRIADEFELPLSIEHATDSSRILKEIKQSGYDVAIGPTMTGKSKVELSNQSWELYRLYEEADIPFALMTDHPVVPIDELITSARNAVKYGLSERKALEAITVQAARHLQVDERTGSIEAGKDADLVVWARHPFRDYRAEVRMVIIEGEIVREGTN